MFLQEDVLGFIYDAYLRKESGNLVVPESLRMRKEMSNHREIKEMKSYRTKNRCKLIKLKCSFGSSFCALLEQVGKFMCIV